MLYIVATPIGNLKDITLRSLEVLQSVDGIICEDSRITSKLLNHYQIKKPLYILNDYNETKKVEEFIDRLKRGENLALVSDAGTPLINDPGYKLIRECINQNLSVDSLPGPTSMTTALTLSTLPPDKFLFLGYFPEKQAARLKLLQSLKMINQNLKLTYLTFVSPHKLITTLYDMQNQLGDIEVVLVHELTKIYQYVYKKPIHLWTKHFETVKPKGEFVMLFRLD